MRAIANADVDRFAAILRETRDIGSARHVHAELLESKLHQSKYLRNLVIEMYGNSGGVEEAHEAFESISHPNSFSWNIMIKVYAQNGHAKEAMGMYHKMLDTGVEANQYTYASVISACSTLEECRKLHAVVRVKGLHSQVVVGSTLVNMFAKLGSLEDAKGCFDEILQPNAVSWTSLIAGYAQNGYLDEAKHIFDLMPEPGGEAYNALINAFSKHGQLDTAKEMYDAMPRRDVVSETSMVSAYARNGYLEEARILFEGMERRNVVSWNVMVDAYIRHGKMQEAKTLFDKMPKKDTVSWTCITSAYARRGRIEEAKGMFDMVERRDVILWNAMLAGYASSGYVDNAKQIFDQMPVKDSFSWNTMLAAYALNNRLYDAAVHFHEMPNHDAVSWNTMISCYACYEMLVEAKDAFEAMPCKNVVSWNAMILAYTQSGYAREGINLLQRMDLEGVQADRLTFVSVFHACACISSSIDGKIIHKSIVEAGLMSHFQLDDCLVNMYAKCGDLEEARSIFNDIPRADVESWNAMLAAYSQCGLFCQAIQMFQEFDLEGMFPNDISFVRIISACSHAGMVQGAWNYFIGIRNDYFEDATMDHFLCIVDVLGRAGQLREAEELIQIMPFEPDPIAWTTLLAACKVHGDEQRAMWVAIKALDLEPESSGPYILLSNLLKDVFFKL